MIGLPYGEKNCDDMLSRFHMMSEHCGQTDRQTDGRTDRRTDGQTDRRTDKIAISISRVSVLTRDKNEFIHLFVCLFVCLFVIRIRPTCQSLLHVIKTLVLVVY